MADRIIVVGSLNPEKEVQDRVRVLSGGYCTLHNNRDGGGNVVERIIVASRGRNPNNPSDRTTGAPTEQRLEPNSEGLCNTLTSVQKDNYVLEIRTVDDG